MPIIAFTEKLGQTQLDDLTTILPDWQFYHDVDFKSQKDILLQATIISGFINASMIRELLAGEHKLKWLQTWSAGVDNLPLKMLREHKIILTNASGVHSNGITEVVFAMFITLARNMQTSIRMQTEAKWKFIHPNSGLHGKTMGILGVGEIGKQVAKIAAAMDMHVLGLNTSGEPCSYVDKMYTNEDLDKLLAESDYLVNILPLTARTKHYMGVEKFAQMKQGAIYVNVGRGATTDTDALLDALKSGRLAGAGLDVFEEEPLPATHELWGLEQVIITPHTAGLTSDYTPRVWAIFRENLFTYLQKGQNYHNIVDLEREY